MYTFCLLDPGFSEKKSKVLTIEVYFSFKSCLSRYIIHKIKTHDSLYNGSNKIEHIICIEQKRLKELIHELLFALGSLFILL